MSHAVLDSPSLALGLAFGLGIAGQILARHLRLPGIVVLLALGVAAGPDGLGWLRPETIGSGLSAFVSFAVAIILFEGGLALDLRELVHQALPIRRLVTLGAALTALLGTVAARLLLDWSWGVATLFGTLVIVTGPTVIQPLMRRIRVQPRVATVLEAEGILGDAIGATVAVVALEVLLASPGTTLESAFQGLFGRLGFGIVSGLIAGGAIAGALGLRRLVPEGLRNVTALALLVAFYQASDALESESGILTAIVAGLMVGNLHSKRLRALREFKEELTTLMIGILFVLLAADVRVADVLALGWPGALLVALLVLVVRPANVAISTAGSDLAPRERAFLAWLAPRGIVAAAVASHFRDVLDGAGIAGGRELRAMVFLVIAATVTVQGLSGGLVARALGVALPAPRGWGILGANALGRTLARLLGEPVTLVDTNPDHCRVARREGLVAWAGNALDESVFRRSGLEERRDFLAVTPNEEVNFLFAGRVREMMREAAIWVALRRDHDAIRPAMLEPLNAEILFDGERAIELWSLRLERRLAVVESWVAEAEEPSLPRDAESGAPASYLPLVLFRDGRPMPHGAKTKARQGDRIAVALFTEAKRDAEARLALGGWQRVAPGDDAPAAVSPA